MIEVGSKIQAAKDQPNLHDTVLNGGSRQDSTTSSTRRQAHEVAMGNIIL